MLIPFYARQAEIHIFTVAAAQICGVWLDVLIATIT